MIWKIILSTSVVVLIAGLFYIWQNQNYFNTSIPCEKPISYDIGTFDRRFKITQKSFLSALAEAEIIWEKPIGKELFAYKPDESVLSINLIYDERQAVTSTLSGLGDVLEENESAYRSLEEKYVAMKSEYESTKRIYDARASAFEAMNDDYERMVKFWNESKRNSKAQFEELEKARLVLEEEIKALNSMETEHNMMAREINTLVGSLNRMATSLNLNVERYNTIGASRGETFTGGVYSTNDGKQSINIYEFSSREKLVRILAHELGHALGLEHNDDRDAIMYYLNEGDAGTLAETDLRALRNLCGAN